MTGNYNETPHLPFLLGDFTHHSLTTMFIIIPFREMSPKNSIPRLPWDQLTEGPEIASDVDFVWHRGFLREPGVRKRVVVCYKTGIWAYKVTTEDLIHEAQVLLRIKGLRGVPQVYGITDVPPIALVMSLCPGRPLKRLQRSATARTYLSAIREACIVLGSVHRKGVVHGNISANNILVVTRRDREDVRVSLVGFDHGEITRDKHTVQVDADSLVFLLHEIADSLSESSTFYQHRDKLRVEGGINLTGIIKLLCSVMHEEPAKCPKCKKLRPGK